MENLGEREITEPEPRNGDNKTECFGSQSYGNNGENLIKWGNGIAMENCYTVQASGLMREVTLIGRGSICDDCWDSRYYY